MPARHHRSLLCALAFAGLVRGLNVTVDDADPRVQYFPANVLPQAACKNNPTNDACIGQWWVEHDVGDFNNTIHDTLGPDASCILIFQGSALTMFGVTLNVGAIGVATLDNGSPQNISFVSRDNLLHAGVQLYHIDGLDPSQNHEFKLTYQDSSFGSATNHHWMAIDYFVYETPPDAASLTSGAPLASASTALPTLTTTDSSTSTSASPFTAPAPGLSPASIAIIAGSVAAAVVLLTGGALILWFTYHPRNRPPASSLPPAEYAAPPPVAVRPAGRYPFTGRGSQTGSSNSAGRSAGHHAPRSVSYPSSHSAAEPPPVPPPPVPARRATRVFRVQNPDAPPSAASEG